MTSIKRDDKSSMFCMLWENVANMPIEEAVDRAVNECIKEGILADFLLQNKAEAIAMSIFEYNQEAHMKCVRQEGYDDGIAVGKALGITEGKALGITEGKALGITEGKALGIATGKAHAILELLEDLGTIPDALHKTITAEQDLQQLKKWLKLASKAETIEQFMQEM